MVVDGSFFLPFVPPLLLLLLYEYVWCVRVRVESTNDESAGRSSKEYGKGF